MKIAFQSKTNRANVSDYFTLMWSFWFRLFDLDLDLELTTLIDKFEPDIHKTKTYLHTKNEASRSQLSKVGARTGHTDTWPNSLPRRICGC